MGFEKRKNRDEQAKEKAFGGVQRASGVGSCARSEDSERNDRALLGAFRNGFQLEEELLSVMSRGLLHPAS